MAKIDEVKEWIGFLKVVFVTLIAIDTSLIAWFFKGHLELEVFVRFSIFGVIILISLFVYVVFISVLKSVKRLRKL